MLESGTTFDLYVAELAAGYESHQAKVARGEKPNNFGYSQEQLQSMMFAVRGATYESKS